MPFSGLFVIAEEYKPLAKFRYVFICTCSPLNHGNGGFDANLPPLKFDLKCFKCNKTLFYAKDQIVMHKIYKIHNEMNQELINKSIAEYLLSRGYFFIKNEESVIKSYQDYLKNSYACKIKKLHWKSRKHSDSNYLKDKIVFMPSEKHKIETLKQIKEFNCDESQNPRPFAARVNNFIYSEIEGIKLLRKLEPAHTVYAIENLYIYMSELEVL